MHWTWPPHLFAVRFVLTLINTKWHISITQTYQQIEVEQPQTPWGLHIMQHLFKDLTCELRVLGFWPWKCWVIHWSPYGADKSKATGFVMESQPQVERNSPARQPGGTDWRQEAFLNQSQLWTEAQTYASDIPVWLNPANGDAGLLQSL